MREVKVTSLDVDESVGTVCLTLETPNPYSAEPNSTGEVMTDVERVLTNPLGIDWSDVARILIPLAFRLLCMAAFGRQRA